MIKNHAASSRPPPHPRSPNRLLDALPRSVYRNLLPHLDDVPLEYKQILHRRGDRIKHVYFPGGGMCSLVLPLADGRMVEVATVGTEGLVGTVAVLDGDRAGETAMVQIAFRACQRMSVLTFRREMKRRGPLYVTATRYAQALNVLLMQSIACNALHSVEARLCRWLLTAHDRVIDIASTDDTRVPLTQEFLAMMLGTSRVTVNAVAGSLQRAGLIDYVHGRITIRDRRRLESAACECYQSVAERFAALLPRGRKRRRTPPV